MSRLLLTLTLLGMLAGLAATPAQAQRWSRLALGVGSAGLGDAGLAFDNLVDGFAQVAPGLVAQRAYPVWWIAEAEAGAPAGPVEFGVRVQGRWAQADALYGDYAGTVDVVGRTRALIGEVGVALPIRSWPLNVAVHGGGIVASTRLSADAVATYDGRTERTFYRLTGDGLGPTVAASVLLRVPVEPVALSARLGARWGRVSTFRAREATPNSQTDGDLRLVHDLSGVTLTVGVGL